MVDDWLENYALEVAHAHPSETEKEMDDAALDPVCDICCRPKSSHIGADLQCKETAYFREMPEPVQSTATLQPENEALKARVKVLEEAASESLPVRKFNPLNYIKTDEDLTEYVAAQTEALKARVAALEEAVICALSFLEDAPDLNPANYSHEQACELNAKSNEVWQALNLAMEKTCEN